MKKLRIIAVSVLSAIITCISCNKEEPKNENFMGIKDISFENYPKVDGSTSSSLLNVMVACKLLGVPYQWHEPGIVTEWTLLPVNKEIPEQYKDFFWQHIKSSKTHGAFMNLIDGKVDIILTHRTISPDEKAHADSAGITLIETPIALDAFVFVVNKNNPLRTLTVSQIQKIYTSEITNWSQVGGKNTSIKVFTRPRNSGSEEVFRELVMDGLEPANFPASAIGGMAQVFGEILHYEDAICYTFNNYKNLQARVPDSEVPKIAVNGIFPEEKTVKNGTFPFISKVHVAIRSDLDHNSMAYRLYEWLQSEDAKSTITECGFLPK
ncbi:MAG: substrate-binding domain-containing protein [Bacteroidota bacterium]|nr:substrate-binding domain-containing protein [Bacteroidota bacterium]